jgi:hypothetical protein
MHALGRAQCKLNLINPASCPLSSVSSMPYYANKLHFIGTVIKQVTPLSSLICSWLQGPLCCIWDRKHKQFIACTDFINFLLTCIWAIPWNKGQRSLSVVHHVFLLGRLLLCTYYICVKNPSKFVGLLGYNITYHLGL